MKSIYCSFFGHQYEVSKKITYHVKEYKCTHCSTQMTTNGKGGISPLTPKFKEINSVLERIHNKRMSRLGLKKEKTFHVKNEKNLINFTPHFS
ncbi:hypothetical protein [Psychroserpens ponticola]|uniref:IS1 family transposase n=1 Tax=Psychroserpens ponticola TaxID=2932268 RepID=A0ABY7RYU7_9FLAO|nr:hypothetical protein [Psychroserpens ponticola]WCO01836.1 hypothetical protein MUN68_017465 [Psychroserpens ponticola]